MFDAQLKKWRRTIYAYYRHLYSTDEHELGIEDGIECLYFSIAINAKPIQHVHALLLFLTCARHLNNYNLRSVVFIAAAQIC